MTKRKIEIFEADSVEEAQELARKAAPEGSQFIDEQVLTKGGMEYLEGSGDSEERAVEEARRRLPLGTEIVGTMLVSPPESRAMSIDAYDEQRARVQAQSILETAEFIAKVVLVSPGKVGFLGIGRQPGRYEVLIAKKAVVRIDYKAKARISLEIYDGTSLLCEDESPSSWAQKLLARKDFRALAAINSSQDYSQEFQKGLKRDFANSILRRVGAEAVPAILEELAVSRVGKSELAELLVRIGDPRAIPLLKKLLDRGEFDAYGVVGSIRSFVQRHPEFQGEDEKVECAVCGKTQPASKTRGYYDGMMERRFCTTTCWRKRGRVLKSGIGTDCPYFQDGICMPEDQDTGLCSLEVGSYHSSCHVYAMHRR